MFYKKNEKNTKIFIVLCFLYILFVKLILDKKGCIKIKSFNLNIFVNNFL